MSVLLCDLSEEAAALSPLSKGSSSLTRDGSARRQASEDPGRSCRHDGSPLVEAEGQFAIAREVAEQMPIGSSWPTWCRLHARMLLDRGGAGDHERAAKLLQEALSAYRTFGMPTYAAEVERLQRSARV